MTTKIDRLSFSRKRLMKDIERQIKTIDTFTIDTQPAVVLSRKEALEELWVEFRANSHELENSRDWIGTDEYIDENANVHEMYLKGLATITALMPDDANALHESMTMFQRRPSAADASTSQVEPPFVNDTGNETEIVIGDNTNTQPPVGETAALPQQFGFQSSVKLPPLQIKIFSGNELDWPEFKATCESTFTTIVDEINRFQYLKGYLKGEAEKKVRHLPMVPGSYQRAWDILKKTYDKERTIINANLKRLFDIEPPAKESAEALTEMLDITNECVAAINSFNIKTDTWDAILIFILTQRLDESSIQHWEERLQGRKTVPKFSEFIEFLEIRINVLKTIATTRSITTTQQANITRKPKVLVTNAVSNKRCTLCKKVDDHFAFQCSQLTQIPVEERIKFISEKGLCINCLFPHAVEKCISKFSCRHCNMRHHSALHPPAKIHNISTEEPEIAADPEELQFMEMQHETILHIGEGNGIKNVTLATAIVPIIHGNRRVLARALIDQGGTTNVITKRLCDSLNLQDTNISLPGVSGRK